MRMKTSIYFKWYELQLDLKLYQASSLKEVSIKKISCFRDNKCITFLFELCDLELCCAPHY